MKKTLKNHGKQPKTMKDHETYLKNHGNQPKTAKNHETTLKHGHGTMKNQSGTIKTNLELDRVVMGGSGGYRRLPGGSDHFSLQTNTQTDTHHNIYITIIFIIITILISIKSLVEGETPRDEDLGSAEDCRRSAP